MKRIFFLILLVGGCAASPWLSVSHAGPTGEAALIETLQSANSSLVAKSDACAKLKLQGTAKSIPALAALLTDEKLSHSARYVLESIPDARAGQALIDALPKTSASLKVGIINSLGARAETKAVAPLGKLLSDADTNVAAASAVALGNIGGSKALKYLQAALPASTNPVHDAEVDGILTCANQMLAAGKSKDALNVFHGLYTSEKADGIRIAAFRGTVLASGKQGIDLVADAIINGDAASQSAALLVASQLDGTKATTVLAGLLPKVGVPMQLALLQCLVQRGDPAAVPGISSLFTNPDADVRLADIAAIGKLGNDSFVEELLQVAAFGKGAERAAARQALLDLNHGPVTSRLITSLDKTPSEVQVEALQAMGVRGDQAAMPAIVDMAQHGVDPGRTAALQALGQLADATQIPRLVKMVADAHDDQLRSDTVDALNTVYQRLQVPGGKSDVTALVKAVQTGSPETRLALLPVCSGLAQDEVRAALRGEIADPDARIRDAATHALCETRDPQLLPDLLKLACEKTESNSRLLAIRGCVRLATQEESVKLSNAQKLDVLRQILGTPLATPDKRLVLSALGTVADEQALTLATGMLDDAAVKSEAEQSVIKIAGSISAASPAEAKAALKKVIAASNDEPDVKKSAQAALHKIK